MQLQHIALTNFRQFAHAEVDFGNDPVRNFHFIIGSNGDGKTNLADAITWCLYGSEFLKKRWGRGPHRELLNHAAQSNTKSGKLISGVTALVREGENEYEIKRETTYSLTGDGAFTSRSFSIADSAEAKLDGNRAEKWNPLPSQETAEYYVMNTDNPQWYNSDGMVNRLHGIATRLYGTAHPELARRVTATCQRILKTVVPVEYLQFEPKTSGLDQFRLQDYVKEDQLYSMSGGIRYSMFLALSLAQLSGRSSTFPLILDSPFIRIGDMRQSLLNVLAELDGQVIVLALDSELTGVALPWDRIATMHRINYDNATGCSTVHRMR